MHPAASVIFFTVASGAGYGLLAILGLGVALGLAPDGRPFALAATGLALGLVSAGLLASVAHLGRPERAWRALSQWRSSWLSREGVSALATFVPAGLFGLGWAVLGSTGAWVAIVGLLAATGAAATVYMTGMIYASLKPIRQWHSPYTVPVYLILALTSGATLCAALLGILGEAAHVAARLAAVATLASWLLKRAAWRHDARGSAPATTTSALGLPDGRVRSVEWPHTGRNFVLKEMAFRVARKQAVRLRLACQVLAFGSPAALLVAASLLPPVPGALAAGAAVLLQLAGLLVERWLFFGEAEHVVALYYDGDGAGPLGRS